ncbi:MULTISPECIES: polysaccharide pyruvyl transferase family protein [unclassified Psychrobacter]|uniref:polysaccharide pyruvyl transferase family protein n=1 Tax=unclassified Psychrobacter TaxID=196806 RepID=UPI003FCFA50E
MKIKTITCHQVYNYGASLQELALVEFLKMNGHEAESIAYKPSYLADVHNLFSCLSPRWNKNLLTKCAYISLKLPQRIKLLKRKRIFNTFEKMYISITPKSYKNNEQLKKIRKDADIFICGSDQIWNPLFPNGKDPAFYLDFAQGSEAVKVSYAASFATDAIPIENVSFVKEQVSKLDFVSVRETSGKRILNDLGFDEVEQVLDPVFLLTEQKWNSYVVEKLENKKYILIYDFDNNTHIKTIAKKLAKRHGLLLIGVNANLKYVDKNYYLQGPAEFLGLVKNAELILTTSFHALAFGLIFKRRLGVFNRNIGINTRMRDLLELIGLSDHLLDSSKNVSLSHFDIDYQIIDKEIDKHIQRSQNFLVNSINSKFNIGK